MECDRFVGRNCRHAAVGVVLRTPYSHPAMRVHLPVRMAGSFPSLRPKARAHGLQGVGSAMAPPICAPTLIHRKLTSRRICLYKAHGFQPAPPLFSRIPFFRLAGWWIERQGLLARHPTDFEPEQQGEADLSTEQAGAQASAWLSCPHGDSRRTQSDRGASGPRP